MDFVWVCRRGDNEELRYSIRSVLASFPDANIFVVGGKPDWYSGTFIKTERSASKYDQVETNLNYIVDDSRISETFVLMNDDFFIVKPISEIKYYYNGTLESAVSKLRDKFGENFYGSKLDKMNTKIKSRTKIEQPLNYELHIPMVMEKQKLAKILKDRYAMWRSSYGNVFGVGGTDMRDVKVYDHPAFLDMSFDFLETECPFLSTEDDAFDKIRDHLQNLFPNKSKYELDK